MPDGIDGRLELRHGPQDRHDPDRRQERQGRDRGRLRPEEHRPVGLRAAARRPARHGRLLRGRAASSAADGKTVQIPDAWKAAWKYFYDGIWTDHFSMTGPQFQSTDINPDGLPVLHRQGRDERELPVVDLRRHGRRRRLGPRGHPVLQRQGDRGVQRRHVPDPQGHQAPGRGVHGPDLPPRRASSELLDAYGGMPARTAEQDAFLDALQDDSSPRHDRLAGRRSTASSTPTTRTSSRSCPPTTRPSTSSLGRKYLTKWQTTPGLDMDAEIDDAQDRDPGDLGQAARPADVTDRPARHATGGRRGGPRWRLRRPATAPRPRAPGCAPGAAARRAGATSSSRRGSSASSRSRSSR